MATLGALAACDDDGGGRTGDGHGDGDGDGTPDASVDAAGSADAASDAPVGTSASMVDCATVTPAGDVWYYDGLGYVTPGPIAVHAAIRFHHLGTHTADHVGGAWSASGDADQCVQFDAAGTYAFGCYFHPAEMAIITVQ